MLAGRVEWADCYYSDVIEAQDLTRRYGQVTAVDRLSLKVAEGELVVLLGGSGSGKTTTLKMVNRLVEPTSGRVLIDGEEAGAIPPHELRRRIGYVFQRVGLFPHMTVGENVGITLTLLGWDRRSDCGARARTARTGGARSGARARSAP